MALDFDQPPLYDPITQDNKKYSDIWIEYWSNHYMTLIGYLTQFGMMLPQLTNQQRDEIISPVNGQTIYNITIGNAQYFSNGNWVSF